MLLVIAIAMFEAADASIASGKRDNLGKIIAQAMNSQ